MRDVDPDWWKEGLSREELLQAFEELFYRALEKWYNVDSFYCGSCVGNFIKSWPGIYNRDMDFQCSAIPLDVFYAGSIVQDMFSQEEFADLTKEMKCPNCGDRATADGFIWPYELKFDKPDFFDDYLIEIASIAEKTPFLMLSHEFAQRVYHEIHSISASISNSSVPTPLFRARTYDADHKPYEPKDFKANKKEKIREGRYNHAGNQVLYLSEEDITVFYEVRLPEDGIMIAQIEIPNELKVLDLMDERFEENSIIQAIQWSSLLSAPAIGDGWHRPQYVFTRFVADVAKSAGFDAIRYPSVQFNKGYNIAVLNYEKVEQTLRVIDFKYLSKDKILSKEKAL
ncbi:RES family NAD+ phosphorylase [Brevibacillus sp. AG]|uniref:RES family NAD+ phosphorylase n=1 Tax=Brevibacillus sp. AG TaxID=3020891 RepID=UPI00232EFA73|nr:RES family NAD+ phosphorylase [Brevibacillus sp. AG]MDC0764138.1 RES family NAD+ phosphorylase [Brevibacillus sp. AG]